MHRLYAGFYSIDKVVLQCCYVVLQCFVTVDRHSVDSIGSEEPVDSVCIGFHAPASDNPSRKFVSVEVIR